MINKIKLTNWRTHLNTTLDFEKGTNVIVGVMGSGKSSIVNAISYGLFGTFPALKTKTVSIKEILMNKPNQTNNSIVTIEFEKDEKKYVVQRELKIEGTNEAKIFNEEKKLLAGPKQKDVNEKIEEILGLNYELFSRAVYAEQNEIDFFLKLSPSERKKKFDELLELEKYEIVRKNSVSLKNMIIKENKQKKDFLLQQKNIIEETNTTELEENINKISSDIKIFDDKKIEIVKLVSLYETEYTNIQKEQKRYNEIKSIVENLKTKISTMKSSLKEISKDEKKEIEIKKINNKQEIEKVDNEIKEYEKELIEFENAIKKIIEKKSVFNYQKSSYLKEIKDISKLSGKCPTCKQELDEKHKSQIVNIAQKEIEKIEIDEKKDEQNENEIKDILQITKKKIDEVRKKRDLLKKEEYDLNQKQKEIQENEQKKEQIKKIENELPIKEKELLEIDFDETVLKEKQEIYFKTKNEYSILLEKIRSKKELQHNYEETLKKIKRISENINNIEKEIEKSEENAEKLGVFENCLTATQKELRVALLETINAAMSSIWSQIYPYKDFLDARILVTANGYNVEVETRNGSWTRVEGILSGGERSAAAICIRIAFSLVLTKQLSMLILDEPTHNLDKNAVEKLGYMLRESLPNLVEQIFVITHDKELEAAATSKIYNLNRDKDNDGITKVEIIENSF